MKFNVFKKYTDIKDFLYRFTILKIGTLHIRIHKICSEDKTILYHNHPFDYISIILSGGYIEKLNDNTYHKHSRFSIIKRKHDVYHRIEKIFDTTYTLFVSYNKYNWNAINPVVDNTDDGIYQRLINEKLVYSKKENGIFFIGHLNKEDAINETRHSIHQIQPPINNE